MLTSTRNVMMTYWLNFLRSLKRNLLRTIKAKHLLIL